MYFKLNWAYLIGGFQSRGHDDVRISVGGQEVNMEYMSMEETAVESQYCTALDPVSKQRYIDLINKYVGRDPYLIKRNEFSTEFADLPRIEAVDITNYLVLQTSFYTKQQMKAYKSLEAYNFFVSGWVHNLGIIRLRDDFRLVFARVSLYLYGFVCKDEAIISTHILTTSLA